MWVLEANVELEEPKYFLFRGWFGSTVDLRASPPAKLPDIPPGRPSLLVEAG